MRPLRNTLAVATAIAVLWTLSPLVQAGKGDKKIQVQLGPRPFYLVDEMSEVERTGRTRSSASATRRQALYRQIQAGGIPSVIQLSLCLPDGYKIEDTLINATIENMSPDPLHESR